MHFRKSNRNKSAEAGFTLVEVLVVLVIIGLIMGLAATTVFRKSDSSRIDAAKVQIESFKQALQLFELDLGRYPTTDEGLKILVPPAPTDEETASKWKGPYIKSGELPKDPWGKNYVYQQGQDSDKPYYLYTEGVQGKPETKVGVLPPE